MKSELPITRIYDSCPEYTCSTDVYTKNAVITMLEELKLEIEWEKRITEHLHYDDLERAESYNIGIDNCIDVIQDRINKLRREK